MERTKPDPLDAIERLASELRLKARLGAMDVRDAWASLEPELEALRKTLIEAVPKRKRKSAGKSLAAMAVDEVELQAHFAAMEAAERWEMIEKKLAPIVDHLAAGGTAFGRAVAAFEREGATRRRERAEARNVAKADLAKARDEVAAAARQARVAIRDAADRLRAHLCREGEGTAKEVE